MAKTAAAGTPELLRIGALARISGCSVPTIRYYEEVGLIPAASRRSSGHRVYYARAIQLLSFIRRCRDFGFSIEQTRVMPRAPAARLRNARSSRTWASPTALRTHAAVALR